MAAEKIPQNTVTTAGTQSLSASSQGGSAWQSIIKTIRAWTGTGQVRITR